MVYPADTLIDLMGVAKACDDMGYGGIAKRKLQGCDGERNIMAGGYRLHLRNPADGRRASFARYRAQKQIDMRQAKLVKAGLVRTENAIAAIIINRTKRHRREEVVASPVFICPTGHFDRPTLVDRMKPCRRRKTSRKRRSLSARP